MPRYKISFSCFTFVNKFLHLLCAQLLFIANYDCEKRTLVVMLTQMQDFRGEFNHIREGGGGGSYFAVVRSLKIKNCFKSLVVVDNRSISFM